MTIACGSRITKNYNQIEKIIKTWFLKNKKKTILKSSRIFESMDLFICYYCFFPNKCMNFDLQNIFFFIFNHSSGYQSASCSLVLDRVFFSLEKNCCIAQATGIRYHIMFFQQLPHQMVNNVAFP